MYKPRQNPHKRDRIFHRTEPDVGRWASRTQALPTFTLKVLYVARRSLARFFTCNRQVVTFVEVPWVAHKRSNLYEHWHVEGPEHLLQARINGTIGPHSSTSERFQMSIFLGAGIEVVCRSTQDVGPSASQLARR